MEIPRGRLEANLGDMTARLMQEHAEIADSQRASGYAKRIEEIIAEFELDVADDEIAGMQLNGVNGPVKFRIESVGYYNPGLVRFLGTTEDNRPVELVQHITQINLLLYAAKRPDPSKPRRCIGFNALE